jgi:AraC-like DNA-binding protein
MLGTRPSTPRNSITRADTEINHHRAVERVIVAMRQRLDQNFSLEDMADVAYMSPFHFNRIFRQLTGVPPCQFMSALRLESARRLLVTTKMSVTEVCFEVGYNSLGTFIRRFTDLLGMSPRRMRSLSRLPLDPPPARSAEPVEARPVETGLRGWITAPPDFQGVVFVGLFAAPIPQGRPEGCAVLAAPGPFRITSTPDGDYHLFAAGLTGVRESAGLFLYESALRAGGQRVEVREGRADLPGDLDLRPALPTDPPILMTFPAWWDRRPAPREQDH